MDEKVAKYLKTYGIVGAFVVLIILLGEFRWIGVLSGLLTLICIVLVCAVLIQQGKGGGLVGALGGMSGDTMFGTTATPVKKFTAALGILFMVAVLCLGRAKRGMVVTRPMAPPPAPTREAPMQMPLAPIKASEAPLPMTVPPTSKSEAPASKAATPAKSPETSKPAGAPAATERKESGPAEAPKPSKPSESPAPKPAAPAKGADAPKPAAKP